MLQNGTQISWSVCTGFWWSICSGFSIYDEKRFKLMELILQHVKENPDDTWAVVQFFHLAQIGIILRNAGTQFGNTSLDERMELF